MFACSHVKGGIWRAVHQRHGESAGWTGQKYSGEDVHKLLFTRVHCDNRLLMLVADTDKRNDGIKI